MLARSLFRPLAARRVAASAVPALCRALATATPAGTPTPAPTARRAAELTTGDLVAANLHVGHAPSRWTSLNLPYILGTREGIHIIDPNQTLAHLRRAATLTRLVAANGGLVLFVANRPDLHAIAQDAAVSANQYYVTEWVPGTLTNAAEVVSKRQAATPVPMNPSIGAVHADPDVATPLPQPDLVILLDVTHPATTRACKEARKLNIPTVAVIDTDVDPRWVTYPIPANDESTVGLALVAKTLAREAAEGYAEAVAKAKLAQRHMHEVDEVQGTSLLGKHQDAHTAGGDVWTDPLML
ncbi:hypothetical protein AMAG_14865 [Allomyces macrogynus ATCC 38327]|uniref:Ribosomal protein S2 n=1 Tax=Allomyces macrogynus (strain ATCC 38327) TaxID=578462 RepID=A0A0L0T5L0_ALLM3|nr:hypothetical protein AMAG_14865 [Allomyces macrogynus ATCC 38327]|eukprot:KNE70030.1 hypothetical protein AMAG_14865 [Allomyces macrogynus ATCC 38327]